MKIVLGRDYLDVVPESLQDEVYLTTVLGVKKTGDVVGAIFLEAAPAGVSIHSPRVRLTRVEGVN